MLFESAMTGFKTVADTNGTVVFVNELTIMTKQCCRINACKSLAGVRNRRATRNGGESRFSRWTSDLRERDSSCLTALLNGYAALTYVLRQCHSSLTPFVL